MIEDIDIVLKVEVQINRYDQVQNIPIRSWTMVTTALPSCQY